MYDMMLEYVKSVTEDGTRLIHEWQCDIIENRGASHRILLELSDVAYWQLVAYRDTLYNLQHIMYENDEFDNAYLIKITIDAIDKQVALVWAFEMNLYRF